MAVSKLVSQTPPKKPQESPVSDSIVYQQAEESRDEARCVLCLRPSESSIIPKHKGPQLSLDTLGVKDAPGAPWCLLIMR